MKHSRLLLITVLINCVIASFGQEHEIRIAFIGNSITYGSGLASPETDCYPSQLQVMLNDVYGDTCVVGNYAVSGRTLLRNGDYPLWDKQQFADALQFVPNICVILLGTNDSKPQNWDTYGHEFIDDYLCMIDTFLQQNANTEFIVCYPPPAYEVVWNIRDSVIVNGVIPAVDSVMKLRKATLIDFYTPLIDSVNLFPDRIHPNANGAKVMAEIVYEKLIETDLVHTVETGYAVIDTLQADKYSVLKRDTVNISWSTSSADSVTLNGALVDKNGSKQVVVKASGSYELIAYGQMANDTSSISIEVQDIEIVRVQIVSSNNSIFVDEPICLELECFDQYDRLIDTLAAIEWIISEGEGELSDQDTNSIHFTSLSTQKVVVKACVNSICDSITFTADIVSLDNSITANTVQLILCPASEALNIPFNKDIVRKRMNKTFKTAG